MPAPSLHRPVIASDVQRWDIQTEVAIVGLGGAGGSAAIEAAAAGAKVTLFEVASGGGGSSALSGGEIYLGGGTDVQRANGFEDSVEELEKYLLMAAGPHGDAAKCKLYANESLNHFAWLKAQGVPYKGTYLPNKLYEPVTDDTLLWSGSEAAYPYSETARPAPRGHAAQAMGMGAGRIVLDALESRAREAGVDIITDARALGLIVDGDRVVGLVVKIDNRDHYVLATRGVVLTTGGFCFNNEMLARYVPRALKLTYPMGAGHDNGSGIQMGMSVGADAIHMDEFFTTSLWMTPEPYSRGVLVNQQGQRFINEDAYHGRVTRTMIDQVGDRAWLLVDNAHFEQPVAEAKFNLAAVGDSWEEVERELGLPDASLSATMNVYNKHAEKGEDPLFHKKPPILVPLTEGPFAAIEISFESSFFAFMTLGGLATLATGEVLHRDGQPIPGLYAAGRVTSGMPASGYHYASGMSLGDATFFGRQAGKSAGRAPAYVATVEAP